MKAALLALAAAGMLVLVITGLYVVGGAQAPAPAPQPAPAEARGIVDPFKAPAAAPAIVDPFKAQPVAAGCPAGFVDQGGLCVGQASLDYKAEVQREEETAELAKELAKELRKGG